MAAKPVVSEESDDAMLDRDRRLSMADEGGASGAVVDAQRWRAARRPRSTGWRWAVVGVAAAAALGLMLVARRRV